MAENIPLTNQNPSSEENAPAESDGTGTDALAETGLLESIEDDLLEEELEELVIEDFTIDGICGVY